VAGGRGLEVAPLRDAVVEACEGGGVAAGGCMSGRGAAEAGGRGGGEGRAGFRGGRRGV